MFSDSFKINIILSVQICKKKEKRKKIKFQFQRCPVQFEYVEFNCPGDANGYRSPVPVSESQARVVS